MERRSENTAEQRRRQVRGLAIAGLVVIGALVAVRSCASDSAPPTTGAGTTDGTSQISSPGDSSPSTRPPGTRPLAPGATTTWLANTPCAVSPLLVPSCGAWLGASTPSRDRTFDYVSGLDEYESVAQNAPDIQHFYKKDAMAFPTLEEIALSERPGKQRSILYYNWKPSTLLTWRDVANGGADDAIATVADGLRHYDHQLFLAVWHEPENDQRSKGTPADYVAMYRHVVTRLRDLGVTNAVYVMNYMGFSMWADVVDDFYPGDDVVDWIAYDPYGFDEQTDFGMVLNFPAESWPGFYSWATATAPDKPIMLGEWGIDLARQPDAAAVLDGAVTILENEFPQIKALVYWNDHVEPNGVTVRLDEPTQLGADYADAYRRFAQSDYFNSTSTDQAG